MNAFATGVSLVKSAARVTAGAVSRSPRAVELLRTVPFPGKRLVVHRLADDALPRFVTASAGGVTYDFDLEDLLDRAIYFNAYENRDLQTALNHCRPGGVCLDAGAAMGYFTINLALKVGPSGKVHAFEPDPYNYSRLKRHCELNGVEDWVHLNQSALSDREGTATFYRHRGASADGTLEQFGVDWTSTELVRTETLDGYLARCAIADLDFAKVDVEGHELRFLEGAAESLGRKAFKVMLVEFNGGRLAERGETLQDLVDAMGRHGYVAAGRSKLLLKALTKRLPDPTWVNVNLLFKPRDP